MSNKAMPDMSDMESINMRPGDLMDCGITAEMIDEVMSQPTQCELVYAPSQYVLCRRCWHIFDIYKTHWICDRCGEEWKRRHEPNYKWVIEKLERGEINNDR